MFAHLAPLRFHQSSMGCRRRSNHSKLPQRQKAITWMSQSEEETVSPLTPRIVMVARPTPAEANRANQRARRSPRHGERASARRRAFSLGSRGEALPVAVDRLDSGDVSMCLPQAAAMLIS